MTADSGLAKHLKITETSPWIERYCGLVPAGGQVLDLACGGGRHTRLMLERGHGVTAVDINVDAIRGNFDGYSGLEIVEADLEMSLSPFEQDGCLADRTFDGVIVVNYLFRSHLEKLVASLKPGGVLLFETFAAGNENYARPRNPDHLLRSGELLDLVGGRLQVVAYEHGLVKNGDIAGVKQRIVAVNDLIDNSPSQHHPLDGQV